LQRRFSIVDILFRSGDIRDQSAKSSEIARKSMFWGRPQILDLVFKTAPISDHVAKFRGDRPRDRGDLKKKKEKRKKHQQNIRARALPGREVSTFLV